ncbi:hypothetical protein [Nocardia salmonicida]|uniref:hypothetical protein n=1 Tax=Nocardia salmonicida TaxID=53431 RepID=UPI0007A45019|nr:hypothetical protein [Nocardia salmonicida]
MTPQARVQLADLAEDMHTAAVEVGDVTEAGGERQFVAKRAVRADDLRRYAYGQVPEIEWEFDR